MKLKLTNNDDHVFDYYLNKINSSKKADLDKLGLLLNMLRNLKGLTKLQQLLDIRKLF